jgi:ABC-type multidrug transport system fused ATPase/permease subunit
MVHFDGQIHRLIHWYYKSLFEKYKFIFWKIIVFSINLKIHQGSLVALVGTVGSGKTSILAALLGEMNKMNGEVYVSGTIAYVPQTAWILNATLKQNILFGKDLNEKLYDQVIEACALKPDLGIEEFRCVFCFLNEYLRF